MKVGEGLFGCQRASLDPVCIEQASDVGGDTKHGERLLGAGYNLRAEVVVGRKPVDEVQGLILRQFHCAPAVVVGGASLAICGSVIGAASPVVCPHGEYGVSIQRCSGLYISIEETCEWDLASLLAGSQSTSRRRRLVAISPWFEGTRELTADELALLATFPETGDGLQAEAVEPRHLAVVESLIERGLLVRTPVEENRGSGANPLASLWHPLAALAHRHLRWRNADVAEVLRRIQSEGGAPQLLDRLGTPPSAIHVRSDVTLQLPPVHGGTTLAELAAQRATCRNFDIARELPLALLSRLLESVYAARGTSEVSGVAVLKKNTPSAGGLHPVEAYLLVQRVEELAPGLYHYRPDIHGLESLRRLGGAEASEYASLFVARQPWFVDAHVQVILVARFQRNYWKYRNHAKAYRAVILDAGHLSQMQYLVAAELGLGAFITAAINEGDIEDAFGLDPMEQGVIAVTGFGWRGERMEVLEFDPQRQVWPDWTPDPA